MIQDIIDYIKARILEIDPDLIHWEYDVFGNNDDSTAEAEKFYNIIIGELDPNRDGNGLSFTFPVDVTIGQEVGSDFLNGFAGVYDKGIDIGLNIVDPKNIYTYNNCQFSDIELIKISPEEQKTNDSVVSCRLQFNLKVERSFL